MTSAFLVVGQLYVTIPLVGDIATRFEVEPGRAALAGSAFGIAYATGFLIFGPLSDRYGRRPVLVLGLVATGLATAVLGLVSSFSLLLAARALQGLAASSFPPVALSLVTESLPPSQRSFAVSLMSFAFLGAAPLAQFFAAWVEGGLPAIMLAIAPLYLLGAIGLFSTSRSGAAETGTPSNASGGRLQALLRERSILGAWAAATTVLFGFVSFHAGVQALDADLKMDVQMLRLIGLPPLLLTFAAAPLTRHFGALATAQLGLLLAALSLGLAVAGTPKVLMLAGMLLSAGVAVAIPGLIATIAGRATNTNRGLALSVYTFTLFLGASIAPPIAQALAAIGTIPLFILPIALLLLGTLSLAVGRSKPSDT
ncbi:MFS transporter [Agrobacterium sp. BT-220-3]|nr:MFS transporter [Agrobacterium sp. BT-220-3]